MQRLFQVMFKERVILLGTASLFALAAASAIQFVTPAYRAQMTIGPIGDAAENLPRLEAAIDDPALHTQLASDGISFDREATGFTQRLVREIEAVRSGVSDATISVWIEGPRADATMRISGFAPTEAIAQDAVESVGTSLVRSIAPETNPAPPALLRDPARVAAAGERLAAADVALAAAEETPDAPAAGEAGPAGTPEIGALDAYRQWLSDLILDPLEARRAAPRPLEPAFQGLLSERDRLVAAIDELELTLLDGHPRLQIARLRLQDIAGEIVAVARQSLRDTEAERTVLEGAAADSVTAAARAVADARARRDEAIERATAERVAAQAELAALETAANGPSATAPEVPISAIVVTAERPSAIAPAIAAALLGFVIASLFVLLRTMVAQRIAAGPRLIPSAFSVNRTVPVVRSSAVEAREGASREEIVSGLLEAGVRRAVTLASSYDGGSIASVDIARRLTLEGRSVLLVDLSNEGRAATAMGVPSQNRVLADRDDARGLRSLVSRDFATTADAVRGPCAQEPSPDGPSLASIAGALEAAERDYDVVIIEANGLPAEHLRLIADEDAAVLLSVEGYDEAALEARLADMANAGLEPPLLVLPSRRPDAARRIAISDAAHAPSS